MSVLPGHPMLMRLASMGSMRGYAARSGEVAAFAVRILLDDSAIPPFRG